MTAINEKFLYGLIQLETAAWSSPFTWVDRTATIVGAISYSEGGRVGPPGQSQTDVGNLTVTFKSASTVPIVGDIVRLRRYGTSEYAFTGYVQDVSQRIVFDNTVKLSTPIVLTTINCMDWVGYVSQFQAIGAGGADKTTGTITTTSEYNWASRIAALNLIIDPTYSTLMIQNPVNGAATYSIGDTDFVGSIADHLDLLTNSTTFPWFGNHTIPTNITTGRTSLVAFHNEATSASKTFTDAVGTSGQLHYTEIDFQNSTQNVANTIIVNNRVRFEVPDIEVTKIGGFNENNYMVINDTNVVGLAVDGTQKTVNSTSITTYGNRQTEIQTCVAMPVSSAGSFNMIQNPSIEYSDDGWVRGNTNCIVRRRKPTDDANPFSAYTGLWAMRSRQIVASPNARILFSGGEADGIPVVAGTTYYWKGYGARGTTSRTDMRALLRVQWYDDTETLLSTTTPATTALTTANTWYLISGSAAAPANAVRATIEMLFERSGGGNVTVGDRLWADAWIMSKVNIGYFDGDTQWDATNAYAWTGGVGASPSYKFQNNLDDLGGLILTNSANTSMRATRIRWNAQEDLSSVSTLSVGRIINIIYNGTTTSHRIVGIDGNVDPQRYMIDYYLLKVDIT
jgi:hypothetical protein